MMLLSRVRDNSLYGRWNMIKQRCSNANNIKFERYGGRGITYSDEWETFEGFSIWALSNGYEEHLTIDRIDNDGNYEPNNCRWVNQSVQQNNRSNNRLLEYEGELYTLSELSKISGFKPKTISRRLEGGMSVKDSLKENLNVNYLIKGDNNISLRSICKEKNMPYKTVHARVSRGWSIDKALNTPVRKGNYKRNA